MNIVSILLIAAGIGISWLVGMLSMVSILRKYYPFTFFCLNEELRERKEKRGERNANAT